MGLAVPYLCRDRTRAVTVPCFRHLIGCKVRALPRPSCLLDLWLANSLFWRRLCRGLFTFIRSRHLAAISKRFNGDRSQLSRRKFKHDQDWMQLKFGLRHGRSWMRYFYHTHEYKIFSPDFLPVLDLRWDLIVVGPPVVPTPVSIFCSFLAGVSEVGLPLPNPSTSTSRFSVGVLGIFVLGLAVVEAVGLCSAVPCLALLASSVALPVVITSISVFGLSVETSESGVPAFKAGSSLVVVFVTSGFPVSTVAASLADGLGMFGTGLAVLRLEAWMSVLSPTGISGTLEGVVSLASCMSLAPCVGSN